MKDTINRRTVLTGTAASAVAAVVPASAAVAKSLPAGDLDTRYRDGIWGTSLKMPRDARVWIDTARAAGLTVELGRANGHAGVFTGYNNVPADVRDFLQSWGGAIPTGEVVEELEAEGLSPNDRRLIELQAEYAQTVDAINNTPGDEDVNDGHPLEEWQQRVLCEMADTPADSVRGIAAKLSVTRDTREPEPDAVADKIEYRALLEIERLAGGDV
jgi:hypothetical protein